MYSEFKTLLLYLEGSGEMGQAQKASKKEIKFYFACTSTVLVVSLNLASISCMELS